MRKLLFVLFLTAFAHAQTALVPSTTLTAETANNTSASSQTSALTAGHAPSGNISKVPMRSLLYSGANTKVYAALMGWFGKSSHINVGYSSQDPAQLAKQVADMKSRGIDGTILAWYGKDSYENKTALGLKAAAEANQPFEFAIMIDRGTLDWDSMGLAPTDALIVHLNYLADNYYSSPAYARINGRPVVYEFALEAFTIDWTRVRASIKGNPMIIFRNPNGWTRPTSDGAYAWEPDKSTTSYLDYFYKTALNYPNQQTVGGVSPSFNDSLAAWTQNRYVDPQCGQTWLMKWADQKQWYSSSKPLNQIQIATWNDYEEGSTIESGIDNCVNVSTTVSGNSVSWSLSGVGLENTIDHYTVYISADGENLMPLGNVPSGTYAFDLSGYQFLAGNYSVYVQAVAKPALTNKMSNAATFVSTFNPNQPPIASLSVSAASNYTPSTVTASTSGSVDKDGTIASSTIYWGDGATSAGPTATHVYASAGTYTIAATVTDNQGATASTASSLTVQAASVVIAAPLAGTTLTSPVHVEASTNSGAPITGMWVYVDDVATYNAASGSLSADIKMSAGTHTVLIKAWDTNGTITQNAVVINVANVPPIARLALSASSALSGVAITADASGSSDSDGSITATTIDFGDGYVANSATASHAYSIPGTYTVKATVTDNAGAATSTSATVQALNRAPVAKMTLTATSLFTGTALTVSNAGSTDADGTIASTTIDFGDGYVASGASAAHAYVKAGTYTVTLTVTDNLGAAAKTSATVKVTQLGVTISAPLQNTTTTNKSVNVVASAASPRPIASMIVYVDNVRMYTIYASSLNTNLAVKPGSHTILVKAWEDVTGTIYQSSVNINVKP